MNKCLGCMEDKDEYLTVCPHCGYIEGTPPKEIYHITPGEILHKKYIVGKVLGYGGFGITYIGWDYALGRKVAIKEFLPSDFATRMPGETLVTVYNGEATMQFEAGLERFVEEAQRLAKFNRVGSIVDIYDTFIENNTGYIVMECLEGETVKDLLIKHGAMPYESARLIIIEILKTLSVVHKAGIIHRDISPDNIFITKDNKIKLLDFGAARYASGFHSKSLSVILKPGYAPEEQYRSHGNQGPWSDVYATAATLYKMITGITLEESMERTVKDDVKSPLELGVALPEGANTAIMNALNIHAELRTQSADDFINELCSDQVVRVIDKPQVTDSGRLPTWLKAAIISVASIALILVTLIGTGVINISKTGKKLVADSSTRVPYVINKMKDDGETVLEENGFDMEIIDQAYDEFAAKDIIKTQTPVSGKVGKDCTDFDDKGRPVVFVVVSGGHAPVVVPDVSGMKLDEAKELLEQLGFKVSTEEEYSQTEPEGTVLGQDIVNLEYAYGSKLLLTVSKGEMKVDKSKSHKIPNLVGMSYDEAYKKLTAIGMYVIREEKSDTAKENKVLSQSVPSGEEVREGTMVTLIVSTNTIVIPNIQYKTEAYARSAIIDAGAKVKVVYEENSQVAEGNVIKQSKVGKSTADTVVTITVSKGKNSDSDETITIPNVVGKTEYSAKSAISAAGANVSVITETSSDVKKGYVIKQSHSGKAKKGTNVVITVSSGKSESEKITIPNVIDREESSAKKTIVSAGATASVKYEYSDRNSRGIVIAQYPAPGTKTEKGAKVTITVSKGAAPITIPSVVGKSESSATNAIRSADAWVSVVYEHSSVVPKGRVIKQSHTGTVSKDTTVTITVSKGEIIKINIPKVVNLPESEAKSIIISAGARVDIEYVYSSSISKGNVIGQSHIGETAEGVTVTLKVSQGPERTYIPNVVGCYVTDATEQIKSAGCIVDRKYKDDDEVREDFVISQSDVGSSYKGTKVTIWISSGESE